MATAEQVLAMMEMNAIEHPYCIIDADSRKITVPDEYKLLGVESDENVERVYFKCPKIVGDGIDLSTLGLRINYQNANSQKDSYPVDELTVENEFITFSWLLSRKAVAYKGTVKFIVCAVRTGDDGMVSNEWNTTIASAEVLEGLEVDFSSIPDEEGKDLLESLIAQSQVKLMEVGEATEEAKRSAERADTAAQEANAATERANKAAQDAENVVAGKGFIATSEKGIAGGVATLDESGQVPKEQIPDISEKTVTFEMASRRAGVESGDSLAVAFGKLAKYCADLKPHVFVDPVNNLLGTDATLPLAATQGKALGEKINSLKIGSRNLILKTSEEVTHTFIGTENEVAPTFFILSKYGKEELQNGKHEYFTLSYDYEIIDATDGEVGVQFGYKTWIKYGILRPSEAEKKGHIEKVEKIPSNFLNSGDVGVRFQGNGVTGTIKFSNLKIELGNKVTGWSPAPEDYETIIADVNTKIEGVKSDVTELNGKTEKLQAHELCIPGDTTNAPPNNKFLNISLKDRFNAVNRCHYFRQPNGTAFEGCPTPLKAQEFIGYREVYWYSTINVMVKLIEFYPMPGRVWTNFYNSGTWTGWKSITPV